MKKSIILQWPAIALWPNRSRGHHWSVIHRARKDARQCAFLTAKSAGFKPKENDTLRFEFKPPAGVGRFDLDNALAACKGYIDGISDAAGVDDSNFSYELAKGSPAMDGEIIVSISD